MSGSGSGFERRLALRIAAAVATAIAVAAAITFLVVRGQLRGQLDDGLAERSETARIIALRQGSRSGRISLAAAAPPPPERGNLRKLPPPPARARGDVGRIRPGRADLVPLPVAPAGGGLGGSRATVKPALILPPAALGGPELLVQVVDRAGDSRAARGDAGELAVLRSDVAVARGEEGEFFSEREVGGVPVRVLTSRIAPGTALQVARPLSEVNRTVSDLLAVLVLVTIGGTGAAALLGIAVGRRTARPIRELTRAAEEIALTRDLARRIEGAPEGDEIDRLRASFNRMLGALERSVGAQRSLVADASHELRTPLTSMRANVELLERVSGMPAEERSRLLADVEAELVELGRLVDDVVELAREGSEELGRSELRLDQVVAAAVERARRRAGEGRFVAELEPTVLAGDGERLDRAVSNLLDNAVQWSPPGEPIEVSLAGGILAVRDRGPGIAAEDLPRVFDRFYRSSAARGRPGSGLGLAIVRRVAEQHGGRAEARDADGGGAELRLIFPGASPMPPGCAPPG